MNAAEIERALVELSPDRFETAVALFLADEGYRPTLALGPGYSDSGIDIYGDLEGGGSFICQVTKSSTKSALKVTFILQ